MVEGPGRGPSLRPGRTAIHLPSAALGLVLAAAGGAGAKALGAPLPWLLGSLVVIAATAIAEFRPFGQVVGLPPAARSAFIPVIGVSIGAAFSPEIFEAARDWWPTLLALALYIPLAHGAGFVAARRIGGIDKPTAYYGMMPGGLIESATLGEAAGADAAQLATFQFLRLILCIVMLPIGFSLLTGHLVGSAGGAVIGGSGDTLSASDWAVLAVAGIVGGLAGGYAAIPAGLIMGPILLSGVAHLAGWVDGGPPRWLVDLSQLVIGTTLGTRFAGRSPRILLIGLRVTLVSVTLTLLLAGAFAAVLHPVVGERWEAVFLAFAPGGLAEMSLIALSLEISVVYVTLHHLVRILLAVGSARLFQGRIVG